MSIDNINPVSDFTEKYCELTTTTSTSTSTTTTQSTTHTTTIEPKYRECQTDNVAEADFLPGSCNFEENLCGNNVSRYGKWVPITWMRTDQAKYGIDGDHTHLDKKCKWPHDKPIFNRINSSKPRVPFMGHRQTE